MELEKKNIHRNRQSARVTTQLVLDDDVNVPDMKPDAIRIISQKANLNMEQKKVLSGRIVISGKMYFRVLYGTNEEDRKVQVLQGSIPFEETLMAEGVEERDEVDLRFLVDELQVGLINSRKISIKAVVTLIGEATSLCAEEVAVDIYPYPQVYTKKEPLKVLQLLADKKDIFRIKEEINLDNNYPNIYQILWYDMVPVRVSFKTGDDKLFLQGEIQAFILYQGEDENHSLQWMTKTFPLKGEMDCPGASELAIPDIRWQLSQQEAVPVQDFDGEERIIHLEGVLDFHLLMYEEEQIPVLKDAYSTAKTLTLEKAPVECEQLLLNNYVVVKKNQPFSQSENKGNILQTCHGQGKVRVEQVRQVEGGLEVEGTATVEVLYITAEDEVPMDSMTEKIPFTQFIEVPELTPECRILVHPQMENMDISMTAANQLEVKAAMGIQVLVLCKPEMEGVQSITVEPLDMEQLRNMPGMVGYIVRKGDSLWNIAKENCTTIENIKELNQIQSDELLPGQKLIILKNVEQGA